MLEIIALIYLCTKMGKILRKKERKPLFMQIMVVVSWIVSMLIGAFGYGIYLGLTKGPDVVDDDIGFIIYPIMLTAALISQAILFGIAKALSDKTPPPEQTPAPPLLTP